MTFTPPALLPYQEVAKDFIVNTPRCALYLKMGFGKTLTVLNALYDVRPPGNILVVAPRNIARSTWINEIKEWGFPVRAQSLIVNDKDRDLTRAQRHARYAEIESSPPAMYFITTGLFHDLIKFFNNNYEPKSIHANMAKTRPVHFPFGTLIIDEAQTLSNHTSRFTKNVAYASHAPNLERVIEMTGSPTQEGYLKLWSQIYPLDHGARLGTRFTAYRDAFFVSYQKTAQGHNINYQPLPGAEEHIQQRLTDITMSANVHNPLMPDTNIVDIPVVLTCSDQERYDRFAKEAVISLLRENDIDPDDVTEDDIVSIAAANAAVLNNKLLQMASGTLYTPADERALDPELPKVINIHDEKLDMLEYLLDSLSDPVLIAHTFVSDREKILQRFKDRGATVFDGSQKMTAKWNAGDIPILIIHPQSAGHGINLQHGGNTLIWYTLPYSGQQYIQTNARLARMGQKDDTVDIYRLITHHTIDAKQPLRLEKKTRDEDIFLEAINKYVSITADSIVSNTE